MARKQSEIADQAPVAPDYSNPDHWPQRVTDYATAMALLQTLWAADRAYAVADLTILAQARFEVSRQRRLPGYYLDSLRKLHRRHLAREAARASGESFPVPGHPITTQLDTSAAQEAQIAALAAEVAAAPAFIVRR